MFDHLEPLNARAHANLCYQGNQPFHFAAREMLVPVSASEARLVARESPLVFPTTANAPDTPLLPQALLGLQPGHNLHVQKSGKWLGRYVPAHLRRYPFIVAPVKQTSQSETEKTYAILIEPEAPHLSTTAGTPLYQEDGQPSQVLRRVQKVLTAIQRDFEQTALLVQALESADLLDERHLTTERQAGIQAGAQALTGFRVVDEQKLRQLPAEQLATLRNSGALALAYAHLLSLTNLQDGLLAKAPAATPVEPPFDLFGGGNDELSFDFGQ